MLVYMLLNTATEKCYIGSTVKTFHERIDEHKQDARNGISQTLIHRSMREWSEEFWEAVVLQNCYDETELQHAEYAWQVICSSREPGIGYNMKNERPDVIRSSRHKSKRDMPEEEREKFREWGRLGAAKSKYPNGNGLRVKVNGTE